MPEIPAPLGGALTALLIGLLLGLDRERAQKGHAVVFAGIRTFPLFATLSNLAFKGGTVVLAGGRDLARKVLPAFLAMAAVTAVLVALR